MMDNGSCKFGKTTINYRVVRSTRRKKTIEITLDPREGVLVAAPSKASDEQVHAFVSNKAGWIIRKAGNGVLNPKPRDFVSGESLPYLGRQVRMFVEPTNSGRISVRFDHWNFLVQVPEDLGGEARNLKIRATLTKWYKGKAAERLPKVITRWEKKTGRSPSEILIRNQKQRWGSCASDGTLRCNWRIVMAEPALIDYVVVHEMVHLGIQNHSPKFWREMARVLPDYSVMRQRLKAVGPYLSI